MRYLSCTKSESAHGILLVYARNKRNKIDSGCLHEVLMKKKERIKSIDVEKLGWRLHYKAHKESVPGPNIITTVQMYKFHMRHSGTWWVYLSTSQNKTRIEHITRLSFVLVQMLRFQPGGGWEE